MEARLREPEREEEPPEVELARIRGAFATALDQAWPTSAYGPLLGWHIQVSDAGRIELHSQHLGAQPDAGAALLLGSVLGPQVPRGLGIRFDPIDTAPVMASVDESVSWLPSLARGVATAQEAEGIRVCVVVPEESVLQGAVGARTVADATRALLAGLPPERYDLTMTGEGFEMWLEPLPADRLEAVTLPPPPGQPADSSPSAAPAAGTPSAGDLVTPMPEAGGAVPAAQTTQAPPSGGACAR